ncbi:hypothetical protein D3C75_608070 [compost metagenome]
MPVRTSPSPTTNRAAIRMTLGSLNPASASGKVRVPLNTNRMMINKATTSMRTLLVINRKMAPTSMLSTQINSEFTLAPFVHVRRAGNRARRHQTTASPPPFCYISRKGSPHHRTFGFTCGHFAGQSKCANPLHPHVRAKSAARPPRHS